MSDAGIDREHLVAGRIVRPHGVRGEVVMEPATDLIDRVRPGWTIYLGPARAPARLLSIRPLKDRYLLSLEGTTGREQAEELRGVEVRLRREDVGPLPEGVYYRWQLIGLRVVSEDGGQLGRLTEVLETGANDVYEVERPDGTRVLLPAITSVVREIDLEGGQVRVRLLPGLLNDR